MGVVGVGGCVKRSTGCVPRERGGRVREKREGNFFSSSRMRCAKESGRRSRRGGGWCTREQWRAAREGDRWGFVGMEDGREMERSSAVSLGRRDWIQSERKGQGEEIGEDGQGISSGNDAMLITALPRGGRTFPWRGGVEMKRKNGSMCLCCARASAGRPPTTQTLEAHSHTTRATHYSHTLSRPAGTR